MAETKTAVVSFSGMIGPEDNREQFIAEAGVTVLPVDHEAVRTWPDFFDPSYHDRRRTAELDQLRAELASEMAADPVAAHEDHLARITAEIAVLEGASE